MSYMAFALNGLVVKDYRQSGQYPLNIEDNNNTSVSYEYDITVVLEEMHKQNPTSDARCWTH